MKTIHTRKEFQETFKSATTSDVDVMPLNDLAHLIFIDKRANGQLYKVPFDNIFDIIKED